MAAANKAAAEAFSHDNFSASTTPSARTLPAHTNFVLVDNMDTSISILVSLDGGTNFKTVRPGQSLNVDGDNIRQLSIKSASGSVSVECLYGYEA